MPFWINSKNTTQIRFRWWWISWVETNNPQIQEFLANLQENPPLIRPRLSSAFARFFLPGHGLAGHQATSLQGIFVIRLSIRPFEVDLFCRRFWWTTPERSGVIYMALSLGEKNPLKITIHFSIPEFDPGPKWVQSNSPCFTFPRLFITISGTFWEPPTTSTTLPYTTRGGGDL